MEVVINIPQKAYEQIVGFPQQTAGVDILILHKIIQEGKVLPKGHGRLIDADELEELFREVISGIAKKPEMSKDLEHMVRASAMTIEMIGDAPTIIEADKAESEE